MSGASLCAGRRAFLGLIGVGVTLLTVWPGGAVADIVPPPAPAPAALTIAAASDLKFALDDVVAAFKKVHPEVAVTVTYGSSGNFFAQISNGAPFDLFFSADVLYPQKLAEAGLVQPDTQFTYGVGRVVVWVPTASKLEVETRGMQVLTDPSVKRIAIANPRHAPYGRAAEAAMKRQGVYDAVAEKLVLGENIAQATQFVQTGAADVGIVALSLALSPTLKSAGRYWLIPESAHPKLEQAAVILKRTSSLAAAQAFSAFVRGSEGKAVLGKYGFQLP